MRDAATTVLDEPTVSLDPLMEAEIFRKFMDIGEGKTTVIVSHRIDSARLADQIMVLTKG
ncbi:MAG: hypothetical protein PHS80_15695 [Methanothrix sp.]|nr:hypothetical protein [Methanothrix sp.]